MKKIVKLFKGLLLTLIVMFSNIISCFADLYLPSKTVLSVALLYQIISIILFVMLIISLGVILLLKLIKENELTRKWKSIFENCLYYFLLSLLLYLYYFLFGLSVRAAYSLFVPLFFAILSLFFRIKLKRKGISYFLLVFPPILLIIFFIILIIFF